MVSNHGKKSRAKKRARRSGAGHQPSITNTLHTHRPLADVSILPLVPHGSSRPLDLDLAARLVAARRAGCQACQHSLVRKTVAEARPTLAALAGAVYGTLPALEPTTASGPTLEWAPLARQATQSGAGNRAFAAVAVMDETAATELLEDALDHWAAGGPGLRDIVKLVGGAPPRQRPADWLDDFRAAGVEVSALDDLHPGDDVDDYHLVENYGVFPGQMTTPEGPMPMIGLCPVTEGAGIEDLERYTDWEHWGLHGVPDMNPNWWLRARISDRSLRGLVHVGPDGEDDIELWRASEAVTLPAHWWALLDHVQYVLVAGPFTEPDHQALQAVGDAGELLAAVARVSFH